MYLLRYPKPALHYTLRLPASARNRFDCLHCLWW